MPSSFGMSHDDARELVAAYALGAVEPEEAAALRAHFEACEQCAAELAAHELTAASLALEASFDPPPGVADRVLSAAAGGAGPVEHDRPAAEAAPPPVPASSETRARRAEWPSQASPAGRGFLRRWFRPHSWSRTVCCRNRRAVVVPRVRAQRSVRAR